MAISLNGTSCIDTPGLEVDTNTLYVDSVNNRVGIGTSSPNTIFQVVPAANQRFNVQSYGTNYIGVSMDATNEAELDVGTSANYCYIYVTNTATEIASTAASGYLALGTNVTERMRITSAGDVGIGTSSPSGKLGVTVGAANAIISSYVANMGTNNGRFVELYSPATDSASAPFTWNTRNSFAWSVDETEAMRITDTGRVGIGTNNPSNKLQVTGSSSTDVTLLAENTSTATESYCDITAKGSDTNQAVSLGTQRLASGGLHYVFGEGANYDLRFFTNSTARMNIAAGGNVGIGTISPATLCHINGTIRYTNRPAAGTITAIGYDANGDLKNSSSSLRYKYDITDYNKGLAEVMQLRPVTFKFNGEERINSGFIAEEIDALGLDEVMLYDEEGRPDGVLYANMVAILTKAIQEQQATIEALTARIEVLENV